MRNAELHGVALDGPRSGARWLGGLAWLMALGGAACQPPEADPLGTEGSSTSTGRVPPGTSGTTGTRTDAGPEPTADGASTEASTTASSSDGASEASTGESSTGRSGTTGLDTEGDTEATSTGHTLHCGDGVVEGDEACDDGGESETCNVDCTLATCGDGLFNASAGEQCDEGGATALCDADCSLVACGDGLVNVAGGEECDDLGESAACNLDCSIAACGDGITNVTAGESCDSLGESLACDADCSPASCGDGTVNATANETCDAGGETLGCDADCTDAMCGDSVVNATAGEACDGVDLAGATCQTFGFDGGLLACAAGCTYDLDGCADFPDAPTLTLAFSPIDQFDFTWAAVAGAEHYALHERAFPGEPFLPLGGPVVGEAVSHTMPLHLRHQATYRLSACVVAGCTQSAGVDVTSSLAEAVGYFKASNPAVGDQFGFDVALAADGNTLAVGAFGQGDPGDDAGAVYVFARDGLGAWAQQAYLKASNAGADDHFGASLALSGDGSVLAVGAPLEDSSATGIGGNQANEGAANSGAVYVLERDGLGAWSQQAYVKASNTGAGDQFGQHVRLSADGNTLAVGALGEDSSATGIGGDQANNGASTSGAAYVLVRDGLGGWSQQAYVKASNTGAGDQLGQHVALSADGNTLAVGAYQEDSSATGIGGNQLSNGLADAGAAYVFVRDALGVWSQQAYVKASNTGASDWFGWRVALSADGDTLAVSAFQEDSSATGIGGDQANNGANAAGVAYVFVRDGLGAWSQQAYVKASNTAAFDSFGWGLALSGDGNVLAVGSIFEAGSATGIGGNQVDEAAVSAGAVYVLTRAGSTWSPRAYVKASNTGAGDIFGADMALSADGRRLAVGAYGESSSATGIGGDQADDTMGAAGAVYLY